MAAKTGIGVRKSLQLTKEQLDEMMDIFENTDKDGDWQINVSELQSALERCGMKLAGYEIRDLINQYDSKNDNTLSLEEFQQLYISVKEKKDMGLAFKGRVQKKLGIKSSGGTTKASSEGTTHTIKEAETVAFSEWINRNLSNDKECAKNLPLEADDSDLFLAFRDGIILCKLVNIACPGTIDERVINKNCQNEYHARENLMLALNSAESIGCNRVNVGAEDVRAGTPHLILGILWQIIRIGLLSDIDLKHHPGLLLLLEEGETQEDLQKLSPEQILIRWVNYHLRNSGRSQGMQINNLTEDIKDSFVYTCLLHQIAPRDRGVTLRPLEVEDLHCRAEEMLKEAEKIECRSFVTPNDIVHPNYKLNLAFVANLFNMYPALDGQVDLEYEEIIETREEKTYRNWMNSMGVSPSVYHLYSDLMNGLIMLQLIDIIKPGIVDQARVIRKFNKMSINFEKLENCNYAVELGRNMEFSLVGIAGVNIREGNQSLTLAYVWQLMRAYTLKILKQLKGGDRIHDKEIVEWANEKLAQGRKTTSFTSFQDSRLSNGKVIIDLVDSIKPNSVNYSLIKDGGSFEDKLSNAKYAISMARKIGARVYTLPEDIVEVKPKMVMTLFACLMVVSTESGHENC